jgi:hypothetical protein
LPAVVRPASSLSTTLTWLNPGPTK